MLISISRQRFTVVFEASPQRGKDNVVFTEYVDDADEHEALNKAIRNAARRISVEDNHDIRLVLAQMHRTKKLHVVADGFVSMTSSRNIKRRLRK